VGAKAISPSAADPKRKNLFINRPFRVRREWNRI
jgi:hypothetical protein